MMVACGVKEELTDNFFNSLSADIFADRSWFASFFQISKNTEKSQNYYFSSFIGSVVKKCECL